MIGDSNQIFHDPRFISQIILSSLIQDPDHFSKTPAAAHAGVCENSQPLLHRAGGGGGVRKTRCLLCAKNIGILRCLALVVDLCCYCGKHLEPHNLTNTLLI